MRAKHTDKSKILLWVAIVYILSFVCYVPVLLERCGISIPNGLLLLKYLFVFVPAMTAIGLLACEHTIKTCFFQMLSGEITIERILTWGIFTVAGILASYCYSFIVKVNVFQDTYLSIAGLLTSCIYLFMTAFVEEIAWRGFLLERVSFQGKGICSIIFVGIVWAVWHMPMWIIRNSQSIGQIAYLCIWTLLVSVVLGITYYQCRNILFIAMLHATFNICYLAPINYNIAILAVIIVMSALLEKNKHKE